MSPLNPDLQAHRAEFIAGLKSAVNPAHDVVKSAPTKPDIIDIRRSTISASLKDEIISGLRAPAGTEKTLPTMLLYSAEGLKIFEEITYLEEYYLTNTEIAILDKYASHIAERLEDGGIVVELGSGNLRKINILLTALEKQGKRIDYYALDLSPSELTRTLEMVESHKFTKVRFHGLHGTYDDGREWFKNTPDIRDRPRCVISLGSSLGNFNAQEAAQFLRDFSDDVLRAGKKDYMLIGLDGCKTPERVYTAYNDPGKCTERFIMSGLKQANDIMGKEVFVREEWEYVGEWNREEGRHQAYLVPNRDVVFSGELEGVVVKKGERVNIEYSYKFDDGDADNLWDFARLRRGAQWSNEAGDYSLYLVSKDVFHFPTEPYQYAAHEVPSLREWEELWKAWDLVTLGMIPRDKLLSKPIDLRNPCIFYLGHIPTFLDVLLTKAGVPSPVEPSSYSKIFQRGIDPDVDDPTQCHAHSANPSVWPDLAEILSYTQAVRQKLRNILSTDVSELPPLLRRAIWTGFEHEAMHLETLLYMLLQCPSTHPPPGTISPDFTSPPTSERRAPASDEWIRVPSQTITLGLNDPENPESETLHHFGWDNEKPERKTTVDSFLTRAHPITNEEYASFLCSTPNSPELPASWRSTTTPTDLKNFISNTTVHTLFGPVPLSQALDWPATTSYNNLALCASWLGGRIPTEPEIRAIYQYVEQTELPEKKESRKFSAVNGHLVHNGVCETPPFTDLTTANVAFKNWHPTSVRSKSRLLGRGETGGVWEWTSTVLENHEGFLPGGLYPEYTADFFDGKHNVMVGGSWATHARIAGRRAFVNWYQRGYGFMWAGARVVRDE